MTDLTHQILIGDVLDRLRELPSGSVHCCVTSPPYFRLRDYQIEQQFGMEDSPQEYVARFVDISREIHRVLRDDGVFWLNIGDSYCNAKGSAKNPGGRVGPNTCMHSPHKDAGVIPLKRPNRSDAARWGMKCKDLIGIPWMLAFALRDDGWYLRGDHVWGKPNGMPESVEDRPSRSHEYVFLFSKSERYWYDSEAVRTAPKASTETRLAQDVDNQAGSERANGGAKTNGTMKAVGRSDKQRGHSRRHDGFNDRWDAMARKDQMSDGANLRSVWWISPAQYAEAHFAVMPDKLATICILAGSSDCCCAKCGAPRNRVVQKERKPTRPGTDSKVHDAKVIVSRVHHAMEIGNRDPQRHVTASRTLGWEPSCKCSADVMPCTVLDPFAGSGTTLLVARKLGRSSIGIELNPAYAAMARRRIGAYAPLFGATT